ncbi:hypothetical protein OAN22_00505 [Alphaproteobacteria bacterium]|nr:hypothetical protein [Alphaproteobacteria bacterium]
MINDQARTMNDLDTMETNTQMQPWIYSFLQPFMRLSPGQHAPVFCPGVVNGTSLLSGSQVNLALSVAPLWLPHHIEGYQNERQVDPGSLMEATSSPLAAPESQQLCHEKITTHLKNKGGLLIHNALSLTPHLTSFSQIASQELRARIAGHLFFNTQQSTSFYPRTYDLRQTCLMCLEGSASLIIYQGALSAPHAHAPDLLSGDSLKKLSTAPEKERLSLKEGDMVILPPGQFYQLLPQTGPCQVLLLGIEPLRYTDVLKMFVDKIAPTAKGATSLQPLQDLSTFQQEALSWLQEEAKGTNLKDDLQLLLARRSPPVVSERGKQEEAHSSDLWKITPTFKKRSTNKNMPPQAKKFYDWLENQQETNKNAIEKKATSLGLSKEDTWLNLIAMKYITQKNHPFI